jgi:DNA-directed RNA polymerase specialized sigma24 family protein
MLSWPRLLTSGFFTSSAREPEAAQLVKLRYFSGLTNAQAAELLQISERTAKRLWAYARSWLLEEMRRGD